MHSNIQFQCNATDTNKAVTSKPSNIVVLRNLPGKFKCNQDEAQTGAHLTSAADRL